MSYVIQAVLSNAQHPEYGQVTIPFPIPNQNYDCTIELLEPLEIGDTLRQDCQVDELDSFYTVLNALIGTQVTLDELDYLAKRLDSFDDGEAAQFQGMAHKLGLSKIKDLINLTFCCQKATVITDFSDLEKIGREHYMNLNGGCARTEDLEALDGTETAYLLIDSGAGTVTPYGVAYDNSMKLEPLYNGRQFPEYLYDNSSMGLKIVPAENQAPELLWLPASEQQIRRTLLRAGWQDPDHADYTIDVFLLQKEAGRILNVAVGTTIIEYIRNCLKRVRKKESAMLLASQNLEDFNQEGIRELTKPLFAIPPHQFLFNAGAVDKKFYMEALQLEESEYNLIRFPQRGVCLYRCGNERYLLEVHAPAYKEALFGKAGGR